MGLGSMMAGGNPAGERQVGDFYPTPAEVTHALLRWWGERPCFGVWEPCAGDGAMSAILARRWRVVASDIEPRAEGIREHDFLARPDPSQPSYAPMVDTIITNPPFNLAPRIIERAFALDHIENLALLLKSTFWAAARRRSLFERHRPAFILPLTWRPDFLNKGAPTMDVMWCVWLGRCSDTTRYELLSREPS